MTCHHLWLQDSQRVVLRHEQAVQMAEKEADSLREMLAEKESSQKQITAEMEQQLQRYTQELQAECQNLHLLVEQSGAKQSAVQLPPRYYFIFWLIYLPGEQEVYTCEKTWCLR